MTLIGHLQTTASQQGFLFSDSANAVFKTQVQETRCSDLSLIYHHLQAGKNLELVQFLKNGEVAIAVYFKGFRIGVLSATVSKIILANIARGKQIQAAIKSINRVKFMPPSQIEIEVFVN